MYIYSYKAHELREIVFMCLIFMHQNKRKGKGLMTNMIEPFEQALINGGNLDDVRLTLLNQANIDRLSRNAQIEHDFRIATLIKECLLTEPKGSAGYAVSKGIMNRLKEKYRDTGSEKLCRKMWRDLRKEENSNGSVVEKEDPGEFARAEQTNV